MRISDWSSDVCSSDLLLADEAFGRPAVHRVARGREHALVERGGGIEFEEGVGAAAIYGTDLGLILGRAGRFRRQQEDAGADVAAVEPGEPRPPRLLTTIERSDTLAPPGAHCQLSTPGS